MTQTTSPDMTIDRATLLQAIEAFDIDGPERAALPFAARLSQEMSWKRPYSERVIREYKRFMFLSVTRGRPVCPSDEVDEAWHLHLTYTRSYWERFCRETLGREIHHDPTRGGASEDAKHWLMYEDTLAAYAQAFGEAPPTDIWPPPARRFPGVKSPSGRDGAASNAARSNKRQTRAVLGLVAVAPLLAVLFSGGNPFDLVGAQFLLLLIPAFCLAIAIGRYIHASMAMPEAGPNDRDLPLDWQEAAYISGGSGRLATAAMAHLVETGAARVSTDGAALEAATKWTAALSPVEQAVLQRLPLSNKATKTIFKAINDAVEGAFADRARALKQRGLIVEDAQNRRAHWMALMPLAAVMILLAIPRLFAGLSAARPVGYLVVTMLGFGFLGMLVVRTANVGTSTPRGKAALNGLMQRNEQLKDGSNISRDAVAGAAVGAALAVALFGTAALAGTDIAALHALDEFYPRRTTDGSSGCGGGGSGGGCGGGGGGCGGGCGGG